MMYAPGVVANHGMKLIDHLLVMGESRVKLMTKSGIDMQVLSLSEPSVEWMSDAKMAGALARDANDLLAFSISEQQSMDFINRAQISPEAREKIFSDNAKAILVAESHRVLWRINGPNVRL